MTKCKSCGKEILWVTMETGSKMPIDCDSIKKGLVLSGDYKQGAIRNVGVSHFQTCPNANKHRNK